MASLKQLKDRIGSVKSTRKVTQAMKVVSASKLKKSRKSFEANKEYIEQLDILMKDIFANIEERNSFPLIFGREDKAIKNTLVIVFGSDRGLCGAFNGSLMRYVKSQIPSLPGAVKKVLCIGKKTYDALKGSSSFDAELFHGSGNFNQDEIRKLTESLIEKFYAGEFDSCVVFYNHFISSITQKNIHTNLIPLSYHTSVDEKENKKKDGLFDNDPTIEEMAVGLAELYIDATIFSILLETLSGEHGARMAAMDNANRNASEIIKTLTTSYNRIRQASVTNELIEIISGMEAIKKY
jgi:F-type H+-transporting ATPase subunit gamma